MSTTISKGRNGWTAVDTLDFDGAKRLRIETYKSDRGMIVTRAAVNTHRPDGSGYTHAFGLAGKAFGDYSERIMLEPGRGTERAIAEQHARAMQLLEGVQERARAHYAAVAARLAAERE